MSDKNKPHDMTNPESVMFWAMHAFNCSHGANHTLERLPIGLHPCRDVDMAKRIAENERTRQEAIIVYPFRDAPEEFRKLSRHGGDEDWLAIIPKWMVSEAGGGPWIQWMDDGTAFGFNSVSEHMLPDGRMVKIGAHA